MKAGTGASDSRAQELNISRPSFQRSSIVTTSYCSFLQAGHLCNLLPLSLFGPDRLQQAVVSCFTFRECHMASDARDGPRARSS